MLSPYRFPKVITLSNTHSISANNPNNIFVWYNQSVIVIRYILEQTDHIVRLWLNLTNMEKLGTLYYFYISFFNGQTLIQSFLSAEVGMFNWYCHATFTEELQALLEFCFVSVSTWKRFNWLKLRSKINFLSNLLFFNAVTLNRLLPSTQIWQLLTI